jgi:hypothetical protein
MALGDQTDPILVKQGDTRPKIRATAWQGAAHVPVSLTGATVVFNMRLSTNPGTVVVNRQSASLADAANGVMEYTLTGVQTATVGVYQAEFEATLADGGVLTFPSGANYIWIQIGDDIA